MFLLSSLVTGQVLSQYHGSGVRTIFVYKGLTRYPEIGNNPVGVLPNIWGELGISNLAQMSLMKSY